MSSFTDKFFRNNMLFLAVLSLALAVGAKEVSDIKFFAMSALYQFLLWVMTRDAHYYLNQYFLTLKVAAVQLECIAELAVRLIAYIGREKVVEILERYGISIAELYKDHDDKNRPFWKKKHQLPDWIKDIKGKLADMMAEPEMVGSHARMQEYKYEAVQE